MPADTRRGPTGTASSSVDDFGDSVEESTIGGRALPLDASRSSRITSVKVDNLAMVDSVSIEVRIAAFSR